jgi:hypothetical protein
MTEPDLRADVADAMERRQVPTLEELYKQVRASGLSTSFACSGSVAALGLLPTDVEAYVDALIGWPSILQRTRGASDRLSF